MCSSTLYLQKAHHCAIQGVSLSWILCWPASTCRLHCIRLTNVYDARMHLHKQAAPPHIYMNLHLSEPGFAKTYKQIAQLPSTFCPISQILLSLGICCWYNFNTVPAYCQISILSYCILIVISGIIILKFWSKAHGRNRARLLLSWFD